MNFHSYKSIFLVCLFIFLPPAIAGMINNEKDLVREAFQKQKWEEVVSRSEAFINSEISETQKDLYRLIASLALFQQMKVDESIEILIPIAEQSLYYSWSKIFLARLAYVSDNRWLLENSLQGLNKITLKGDIKKESKFYEAHLLIADEKWNEAAKILNSLEKQSRNGDIHASVLESQALVETKLSKSTNYCKPLKKLYVQYPKHIWFESSAPEIKNINLGKKKFSCIVSEKEFDSRRRNLNLLGEFNKANIEIQQWVKNSNFSVKKQNLLIAQQNISEGHPEEAMKILQQIPNYKSDVDVLNSLAFAAARAGDMILAIDSTLLIHKILGFSRTGTMALYQAALWSYQTRDYEAAESRFKAIKLNRISRSYQNEVQWYLGWIRYLRGDFIAAEKSFKLLLKTKRIRNHSESNDRLNYWLAMSQIQNGKREKAKKILFRLSEKKGMNYYSFLARERLKLIPDVLGDSQLTEVNPQITSVLRSTYYTPFWEIAPQPNSQEIDDEELGAIAADESEDTVNPSEERETRSEGNEEVAVEVQEVVPNKETDVVASEVFSQAESILKIERAKSFWSIGLDELARREVGDLENNRASFDFLKKITDEYRAMGLYNRLSSLGHDFSSKADLNSNKFIYEAIYPRAYSEYVESASTETNISKSLIWGIMKAESMYRPWVKSPVGALGLMQVMPTTGQRIADMLDYKNFNPKTLLEPQDAIRFGSKYLERLGKKFDNTVQLVAAAYNAGPHRVSQWLYYFGYMQMDEWVEHIPFIETRNYVKRVTVNYMAYNELYGKSKGEELVLIGPVPVQLAGAPETKESWE